MKRSGESPVILIKAAAVFAAVLTALLLLPPLRANADDNGFIIDPTAKGEGYMSFLYNNTTGLPTSEANAIVQTEDGFIWIGSYGGLIRYDGNTFERMDSTTGIASVVSLFVDSKQRLWIGTNDSGAAVMTKEGSTTMYKKSDGLPSFSVRSFAEDPDGTIYIATTGGIAAFDTDGNISVIDIPGTGSEYVRCLETGADGITYALTISSDVFTLSGGEIKDFYSNDDLGLNGTGIHCLHADPLNPGYIYLGTEDSRIMYGSLDKAPRFDKKDMINVAPLLYINAVINVGDDLWICTNNGICVYRDGKPQVLENIPMTSSIERIMSDYQGNLWFVSSRQGVMKIVPNRFTDVFDQYGLEPAVVNTTCFYDDLLLIGTDTGLIALNRDRQADTVDIRSSKTASEKNLGYHNLISMLKGIRIRSIIRDSKDRIWISTYSKKFGLIRYDHGLIVAFTPEDGMPSERVRAVCECSDGSMLAACTDGVAVIRDNKIERVYGAADGITNTEILTVAEGTNGDILAGTDGGGIFIISGSSVTNIDTSTGLTSDIVMRIKHDADDNVYWIVTSNSIAYLTPNYEIHTIEKFPYSNNFDIYENSLGESWILSSNGIYVIKTEDLIANGELEPVFYGIDNGLPDIATSNSYSCLTDNGDLYIAGTTGVAKVNVEEQFENVSEVKMTVPYIDADGERIHPDSSGIITVPYDVKKITIYPNICTYTLMNPFVTYELEGLGFEPTTIKRSNLSTIEFTNLKGGTYTFRLTLSDSMGHDSSEYSIVIVKQKAIYEQAWFNLLAFVAGFVLLCVIFSIYVRSQTKVLRKKQEENKRLIREIVEAFAKMIDMKDKYTNGHSKRVAEYTAMLTRELGYDEETVEKYYNIALLHDIGKIGIPAEVLNKQGHLDDDEYHMIQSHTTAGANVLKDIRIMPELSVGAESHHERPDGMGYPNGLKGDDIPRVAQIIAVADAFDAMYSKRPYRSRMNFKKVVSVIKAGSGTQFAEDVVEAFLRLVDKGEFIAPDDDGGGTVEDIDNIHKRLDAEYEASHHTEITDGRAVGEM